MVLKVVPEAPPHNLRHLFCVPPPPEREEFEKRYGTTMLWQGYGSTEIYSHPMHLEMIPDVPEDTLGPPVSFYEYGVVDEHDNLLPPDTVGELVVRPLIPHGMVDGYYEEHEATVRAFRNFMFHTGDLVTYDERGLVHYRGRKTERIRSRGEMVSAVEVEYVALRHPEVLEAAVYGVPSELGEEDVKLDVVLREPVVAADLHAWLSENLPRFMVPRYLEIRESFPKTPSERIQKWRLKDEPLDRPEVFDAGERRGRTT
jgi:carnitine-CoA ligase